MILLFVAFQCLLFVVYLFARVYSDFTVRVSGAVVDRSRKACLVCEVVTSGQQQEGPEYHWYKDTKTIEKDVGTVSIKSTNLTSDLCFAFTDELTLGEYVCIVTLAGAKVGNKTTLESMPFFKKPHRSRTVVEGQNLKITCHSWGLPVPGVTWLYKDAPMNDPRAQMFFKDEGTNTVVSTLVLSKVTKRDRGLYKCNASNSNGALTSYPTQARIKGKLVPLWPFIGFFCELSVVAVIILIVEIQRILHNREGKNCDTRQQKGQKTSVFKATVTPSDS